MRSPDITYEYRKEKVYAKFVFDIKSDMQPALLGTHTAAQTAITLKRPCRGKVTKFQWVCEFHKTTSIPVLLYNSNTGNEL
jgi:hypothetical protein